LVRDAPFLTGKEEMKPLYLEVINAVPCGEKWILTKRIRCSTKKDSFDYKR
jgi:hypothetical protein